MNTATIESQPKSNTQALSSPSEPNLPAIVLGVAKRKTTIGQTFSSKKGKASLFSGVCAFLKSELGMGKTEHLNSEWTGKVESAIAEFWKTQANVVLSYGSIKSATFDKPSVKFQTNEKGELQASVELNAKIHATRNCKDNAETKLMSTELLRRAKKRMDYMLDNLDKFERSDMDEQRLKVIALESKAGLSADSIKP